MSDRGVMQLLKLLEDERRAICTASFDVLDTLAEQKTQMFDMVVQGATGPADLNRINQKLLENQTLLAAAINGVRAARIRLDALQKVRVELNVYDQSGQMSKVKTSQHGMEKKA